ncbi:putative BTB/POZ domain-containing protein [Sesbania bispinosa]|nr:putative BTB/POZ domain-containing protein [Sesbania bispinosa]
MAAAKWGVGRHNSAARRWQLQDGGEAFPKLSGGCCTGTRLVRGQSGDSVVRGRTMAPEARQERRVSQWGGSLCDGSKRNYGG